MRFCAAHSLVEHLEGSGAHFVLLTGHRAELVARVEDVEWQHVQLLMMGPCRSPVPGQGHDGRAAVVHVMQIAVGVRAKVDARSYACTAIE